MLVLPFTNRMTLPTLQFLLLSSINDNITGLKCCVYMCVYSEIIYEEDLNYRRNSVNIS